MKFKKNNTIQEYGSDEEDEEIPLPIARRHGSTRF
jgi:hypothetical protein